MQVKPPPFSQAILFAKTLFLTSCFPLLIGLLCEGTLRLIGFLSLSDQDSYQNPQGYLFFLLIRQAKDISYGAYSSLSQFMITMLIIHLLGPLIQRLKFTSAHDGLLLPGEDKKPLNQNTSAGASKSKNINSIIVSFFGYALVYCTLSSLFSIIGTQTSSFKSLQDFQFQEVGIRETQSRMLEEISNGNQPIKAIRAETRKNLTTFPLGRVLGSLNLEGSSVVFSKDETVLFVGTTNVFGVTVVDISNWENPRVIHSYTSPAQKEKVQKVSLLLSPDGKTLFASNMVYFTQFGLDNSNSVRNYQYFPVQQFPSDANVTFQTSLALSPDGTKLFASGYGFQVFDVSKQNDAKLLKYELPSKEFNISSVAVSPDGKSLFLINGTLLNIYNITDLGNMSVISSFESENTPCSFIQSKDGRMLTVTGFKRGTHQVVLERVDVSNVAAPFLTKTFSLDIESFSSLFGLSQSPKETFLYFTVKEKTLGDTKMMVFDTLAERLLEDSQSMISKASSLGFTSNEKSLMVIFEEYIATFQLYRSFPNDRFFTITKNSLAKISTTPKSSNQILQLFSSTNGKFLLSVDEMSDSVAGSRFTFTEITNRSLPIEVGSFSASSNVKSVSITKDAKILFASFKKKMVIYDISDLKSINILGSYALYDSHDLLDAVFTSDGKTCFAIISEERSYLTNFISYELKVFDLSEPASFKEIDSFSELLFWRTSSNVFMALSNDEKTLFVVEKTLFIFDVSARTINKRKEVKIAIEGSEFVPSSISLSPNDKILIIKKEDPISSSLYLFDVSNLSVPTLLNSFVLPKTKTVKNVPVVFSPDSKFVYVEGSSDGKPGLLVFDISNPTSSRFQNAFNVEGFTEGSVDNFIISDDGLIAYLASDFDNKVYIVNLDVPNTVFLGTESFLLGEKSTTDVMILGQKSQGDYIPLNSKYKFVKASLFSAKINPSESSPESTLTPFPYWMSFLKESSSFVVEPKKQRDLGTYTFYSVFSMQLNLSSFNRIEAFNTSNEALIATLISLGYLDSDLYVTGNLGTIDRFFLTTPYIEYKAAIYQVLKDNYFEAFTVFDVVPSLDVLTSKKKLQVQTPSDSSLKIEILFTPFWQATKFQFLNKQYGPLVPLITDNKAKLSMEGSIDDINSALKKLVMDSSNYEGDCPGMITIWDHLNPPINKTLKNLSRYFEANEAPMVNPKQGFDIQGQIDAGLIYTGEYFSINFLNHTFIDKYSESLHFTLTLDNKERSPAPSWLIFSESGLKGTAPEEFLNRKVNLVLTVKNEFRKIEVPITLNIRLSAAFLLKLLIRYSPYILTALGLWVFANRIYNVLGKDKYRHQKEFYVSVGQEITSQDIYPISFLGQEGTECDFIWKHLVKKVNEGDLDKSNIIQEINEIAQKLSEKSLPLYKKGSALSKKLINQLIMNRLALWSIDSVQEKETKRIYEEDIEEHLMDLVKWDDAGYCEVNESKLTKILKKNRVNQEEEEGLEVRLINRAPINVDLLKDVVIAEAMRYQSIRTRALFTHFVIKEEVPGNWIRRFLKLNLWDLQSAQKGQKMAYGIDYEIKNDVLCFSGVAEEKFCGRTIVLQITDLRHKILKEVWIHGVNENGGQNNGKGELEAQGENYEML